MTQLDRKVPFLNRPLSLAQQTRSLKQAPLRKSLWQELALYFSKPIPWPYLGWFGGVQIYQKREQL